MKTIVRDTLASLQGIDPQYLDFNDIAYVVADTTTANNGVYRLAYNVSSTRKADDSNWVKAGGLINRVILASDVPNSAADTLANVTGLAFPMLNGKTYKFRALCVYTADATTSGSRWTVNSTTAPTALHYTSEYSLTTTTVTKNTGLTTRQAPAAANATSAATAGNIAIIEGVITAGASENLQVQFAAEAGTITAKATFSTLEWEQIA